MLLDQTLLPDEIATVTCRNPDDVVAAIQRLAVRGAPVLGIAGAYAVALAAADTPAEGALRAAAARVAAARPTAVNLARGVERALAAALAVEPAERPAAARRAGDTLAGEDRRASETMARLGLDLVPADARILTHCNTGRLVSGGAGTAFAVIAAAHAAGRLRLLWVDETRPLLQGARLTAWEAAEAGIPHRVLADAAAGSLFARGEVDLVVVGADRICADGTVANKVGTYPLAVLAHAHGVPFVVVAPTSTIDVATPTGADVVVEERDAGEVTPWSPAYNPAFDLTPARLVTALVTEAGVARPVDATSVAALARAAPEPASPSA